MSTPRKNGVDPLMKKAIEMGRVSKERTGAKRGVCGLMWKVREGFENPMDRVDIFTLKLIPNDKKPWSYELPGGKVDNNDYKLEETLEREIEEEMGVDVKIGRELASYIINEDDTKREYFIYTFTCDEIPEKPLDKKYEKWEYLPLVRCHLTIENISPVMRKLCEDPKILSTIKEIVQEKYRPKES